MRLFNSASYASAAHYPMDDRNVIDIGLLVIKHCGMYAKEYGLNGVSSGYDVILNYSYWILRKNAVLLIVETIDSFKEYWADAIALVNQTAVLALQHGYSMTAVDNDESVALYGDLLANFRAVYAAMQESMKSQADSMVAMQSQLANFQQFYMAVSQQPPSSIYTPDQQQCTFNNRNKHIGGGQNSSRGFPQQPTVSFGNTGGSQQQALHSLTPYKHWENQNYCQIHSGYVDDTHTSATCGKPEPTHNPNASCTNIMGGLVARIHKIIFC